jgi:hypothetical protein
VKLFWNIPKSLETVITFSSGTKHCIPYVQDALQQALLEWALLFCICHWFLIMLICGHQVQVLGTAINVYAKNRHKERPPNRLIEMLSSSHRHAPFIPELSVWNHEYLEFSINVGFWSHLIVRVVCSFNLNIVQWCFFLWTGQKSVGMCDLGSVEKRLPDCFSQWERVWRSVCSSCGKYLMNLGHTHLDHPPTPRFSFGIFMKHRNP